MGYAIFCLLALLAFPPDPPAEMDTAVTIKEWDVPWENSRPRDPYVDQQGRVWFVGQRGNYVAYLEPESGEFKRYTIEEGTYPHNLIVDREGQVWFAGNRAAYIGRLNPETGETTKFPMPNPAARDPHTLILNSEGNIWFTVQGGNFIGRLNTQSGKVDLVEVPTSGARPYGIKLDAEGRPWVALFGSHKIATVDPQSVELEEIELPRQEARPRRLEITPDGNIWYVDYAGGRLGRLDPETHQVKEWRLPGGAQSRPYGTASDDQGRIWVAESGLQPNRIVGFDPSAEEFIGRTKVPSGGGTIRYMYYNAPEQEVWFGTDANTIGRARLP